MSNLLNLFVENLEHNKHYNLESKKGYDVSRNPINTTITFWEDYLNMELDFDSKTGEFLDFYLYDGTEDYAVTEEE